MKTIIRAILASLFSVIVLYIQAQDSYWEQLSGPEGGSIRTVGETSQGTIYALDEYGGGFRVFNGQTQQWEIRNPDSHYVNSFVEDSQGGWYTVSRRSKFVVHFSDDEGITWEELGVWSERINDLLPAEDGTLYLHSGDSTFKSEDGGANWMAILFADYWNYSLQIDKTGVLYSINENVVDVSHDKGNSWTSTTFSNSVYIEKVLITPDNVAYCMSYRKLYRSDDQGLTWKTIDLKEGHIGFYNLLTDESGTLFAGGSGGLYKSIDHGSTWSNLGFKDQYIENVILGTNQHIYLYADRIIYHSPDGGSTWNLGSKLSYYVYQLFSDSEGILYAGTAHGGVQRSSDHGKTWNAFNRNLQNTRITRITEDHDGNIYLNTEGGFYTSRNDGITWIQDTIGIRDVEISSNGTIYSLAGGYESPYVLFSENNGHSWDTIPWNHTYPPRRIILSQNDLLNITAFSKEWEEESLFQTADNGLTWNSLSPNVSDGDWTWITDFHETPGGHYLVKVDDSYWGETWYRSEDSGESWVDIKFGADNLVNFDDGSMQASKWSSFFFYVGSSLWYSDDDGKSWDHQLNGLDTLSATIKKFYFDNEGGIYSIGNDTLARSTDQGENWQVITTGGVTNQNYNLFIAPDRSLYTVTSRSEIFRTRSEQDKLRVSESRIEVKSYPNPFTEVINIEYSLAQSTEVDLTIYDLNGQQVKNLMRGFQTAGPHAISWSAYNQQGSKVQSGLYFYRLKLGNQLATGRILLNR